MQGAVLFWVRYAPENVEVTMIENSVSFNQSTQNSKTVLSLGAGSTSQSGKQSPAVKESKETFQTALKTATDKSMDAKALPPKTQPSDGKASDLEAAASNPAAEHVTAETETETEVAPVVAAAPAVPDLDDEQTDMTAVSDALVQLLLIALNPDSTDEDVQKSIQTVLEGLSAEQKPLLLEMFESVLAKVEQLKPSDIKQTAALEELLKMLVPEDEARQLLPLITDPKKNIMQPGEGYYC